MSVVNMIQIIFYSLLLSKVLKFHFYLYKILWVHYSIITKKITTKGRAESEFLLLSLSLSLCAKKHTAFGLVPGASQPGGDSQ